MDFQNNSGFSPQGFDPNGGQQVFNPNYGQQGFQQQVAPGFDQMAQEFSQGYAQPMQPNYTQPMQPDFTQGGMAQPMQGFMQEQPMQQDFTQSYDGFTQSEWGQGNPDPFGGLVSAATQTDEPTQKWWKKGARVILLGGVGVLLVSVIVFIVSTNINKNKTNAPKPVKTQVVEQTKPVVTEQTPQNQTEVQVQQQQQQQQQQQPQPVQTITNDWQLIGNTDGYTFVGTKTSDFIVQSKGTLYYKAVNGGMQIRNVAVGTVVDYDGTYEVDLPRSAALYGEVIKGYKFSISFDVYTSADGNSIFLENLRPDK